MTASEKIDHYIANKNDWRGRLIKEIRELVHETEAEITEEWKWNSPVFSHKGAMICSPGIFKNHVGLNFFNGAMLEDTGGLFNSGLESKRSRSINFHSGDPVDKQALKTLLSEAIAYSKNQRK